MKIQKANQSLPLDFPGAVLLSLLSLASPAIAMDANEPNDSKAQATVVKDFENGKWKEVQGLTFHSDTDTDWFKIEIAEKSTLRVEISFDSGRDLFADFSRSDGTVLTGDLQTPQIELRPGALEPGEYYLEVRPNNGGTGSWRLRFLAYDPDTYRGWLIANSDSPEQLSNADPNGDGVPLGLEYVLRRPPNPNPTNYPHPIFAARDGPSVALFISFPFDGTRRPVLIEMSFDFETWTPVPVARIVSGATANPVPAGQSKRVDVSFRLEDAPEELFFRLSTAKVE